MRAHELLVVQAAPVRASDLRWLLQPDDPPTSDLSASAHALLRLVLADLTGRPPTENVLRRRCRRCGGHHGKPELLDGPFHVSLSATAGLVAVAVTAAGEVGVDLERTSATNFAGFDAVALGPRERAPSAQERARAWTRKEAYLKATGDGMFTDPRDIDVRRRSISGLARAALYDVEAPAGISCSAAVLGRRRPPLRVATRQLTR